MLNRMNILIRIDWFSTCRPKLYRQSFTMAGRRLCGPVRPGPAGRGPGGGPAVMASARSRTRSLGLGFRPGAPGPPGPDSESDVE